MRTNDAQQQSLPAPFLGLIACGLLENHLQRSDARPHNFNLVYDSGGFLDMCVSEGALQHTVANKPCIDRIQRIRLQERL